MAKKETAIVKVAKVKEVKQDDSVQALISQAINSNVPVETLERLFALREKVKAEQAQEAFVTALSQFQAKCPIIQKTKKVMNKDGVTVRYQYAPIDAIIASIRSVLAECGFSYTWDVKNTPGAITAICTVTHSLGHSQSSEFSIPIDTEGFMTAPQKVASALTFAKRYTLCNALGISTGDEDTDATDVGKDKSAKSDKSKIMFALRALGFDAVGQDKIVIQQKIKELTQLDLVEKNFSEIVGRLEVLVTEKNEYDQTKNK